MKASPDDYTRIRGRSVDRPPPGQSRRKNDSDLIPPAREHHGADVAGCERSPLQGNNAAAENKDGSEETKIELCSDDEDGGPMASVEQKPPASRQDKEPKGWVETIESGETLRSDEYVALMHETGKKGGNRENTAVGDPRQVTARPNVAAQLMSWGQRQSDAASSRASISPPSPSHRTGSRPQQADGGHEVASGRANRGQPTSAVAAFPRVPAPSSWPVRPSCTARGGNDQGGRNGHSSGGQLQQRSDQITVHPPNPASSPRSDDEENSQPPSTLEATLVDDATVGNDQGGRNGHSSGGQLQQQSDQITVHPPNPASSPRSDDEENPQPPPTLEATLIDDAKVYVATCVSNVERNETNPVTYENRPEDTHINNVEIDNDSWLKQYKNYILVGFVTLVFGAMAAVIVMLVRRGSDGAAGDSPPSQPTFSTTPTTPPPAFMISARPSPQLSMSPIGTEPSFSIGSSTAGGDQSSTSSDPSDLPSSSPSVPVGPTSKVTTNVPVTGAPTPKPNLSPMTELGIYNGTIIGGSFSGEAYVFSGSSDSNISNATPSSQPFGQPSFSARPSSQPSTRPTSSYSPSLQPSVHPSISSAPSSQPSVKPSDSARPSSQPLVAPSVSAIPSSQPSGQPLVSAQPSSQPSTRPTLSLDELSYPYVKTQQMESPLMSSLSRYGYSVVISGDGKMMAVGAPEATNQFGVTSGAVYLYSLEAEGDGSDELPLLQAIYGQSAKGEFGNAVALSEDGSRMVVGSPSEDDQVGAIRIYKKSDDIRYWLGMEGGLIGGSSPRGRAGWSVSISADGNVVAMGSPTSGSNRGGSLATYKYNRMTSAWEPYGSMIQGLLRGEAAGYSTSLSETGSAMVVGFPKADNLVGIVHTGKTALYIMSESGWQLLGQEVYGEAESDIDGTSVAMSRDGSIVVIGGKGRNEVNETTGEVLLRSIGHCSIYQVQANQLVFRHSIVGKGAEERLGSSVAVSSDGNVVACGGVSGANGNDVKSGVVRLWNRVTMWESTIWPRGEVADLDKATFSASLAISADGECVVVGAPSWGNKNRGVTSWGAVQIFRDTS